MSPSDAINASQLLDKLAKLLGKTPVQVLAKLGCDKAESKLSLLTSIYSALKGMCLSLGRAGDRDAAIAACTIAFKAPPSAFGSYIDDCVPIVFDIRANVGFTEACKTL